MKALKIASLQVALALTVPTDLPAQDKSLLVPGDRARLTAPDLGIAIPYECTVLSVHADSLVLEGTRRSDAVSIPLKSVATLEVLRGQKSRAVGGALAGLLVGGVLGAAVVSAGCGFQEAVWEEMFRTQTDVNCGSEIAKGAALGGLGGAALGALVGSFIKTDRWEEIPLDELRIGPSPVSADGVSVSASLHL